MPRRRSTPPASRSASPPGPSSTPARPTTARIALSTPSDGAASPGTGFTVTFDSAVATPAADALLSISPAVSGTLADVSTTSSGTSLTFQPATPLAAGTHYTVALQPGIVDTDGSNVVMPEPLRITTAIPPKVVRFRPLNGTTAVADEPAPLRPLHPGDGSDGNRGGIPGDDRDEGPGGQDHLGGEEHGPRVHSEQPPGQGQRRDDDRLDGGALGERRGPFDRPERLVQDRRGGRPGVEVDEPAEEQAQRRRRRGGGSAGSGAWHAVEVYYLGLMNCTRGGGWVLSSGKCSSPGGSGVKPLILNAGISNKVSRPYAKLLATKNICTHFYGGNPGDRLHAAGYPGDYRENIGCRAASNPYASVLGTHLFFQDEKPCSDYCHWANIMDPRVNEVGIGIWVIGDRVRLVVDFWKS